MSSISNISLVLDINKLVLKKLNKAVKEYEQYKQYKQDSDFKQRYQLIKAFADELRAQDKHNEQLITRLVSVFDISQSQEAIKQAITAVRKLIKPKAPSKPALATIDNAKLLEYVKILQSVEHENYVNSVAFSPDGNFIISGSGDHTIKLWQVDNGELLKTFEGYQSSVRSVAFSPDGKTIISGSGDKTIKLWQINNAKLLKTFEGHQDFVYSVAFSPDGKTIISGSWDKTIKLWQLYELD